MFSKVGQGHAKRKNDLQKGGLNVRKPLGNPRKKMVQKSLVPQSQRILK